MAILIGDQRPRDESGAADAAEETRRRRDPEATRKAILDAGEELFVRNGPIGTSLSQIAKKAGVTKSLIHHHFGSKEELWQGVQRRHFRKYFELQKRMIQESSSTAELLEESIVAYFRFLQQDPKSVRFFSWTLVEGEDGHCPMDEEKELFELGIEKIREAQAAGEIRDDLEPFFIIKTLISLPMAWFQTHEDTRALVDSEIDAAGLDEMYLRDMVEIFLGGVRPRPTS
ncbi:MAG: TetR/AcrR family transcriptional regulator [Acidobacteriota bacterium]